MVTKRPTWIHIATMCIGVGILFVGLDYMKGSVETFAKSFDFKMYKNLWAFGGIGFLVTMLLHSQAAMSLITLAALNSGIITVEAAFAIIIGANVGTTMTALTASLSGSKAHKQIALSHFFQNVIAAIFGIIFFHQFYWLCNTWLANVLNFKGNSVLATARFNTIFNIVTAIPFMIFPHQFARVIEWITSGHQGTEHKFLIEKMRSIGPVSQTIGIQLDALSKDIYTLQSDLQAYIYDIIDRNVSDETLTQQYHILKNDINTLYATLLPLQESKLTTDDVYKLNHAELSLEYIADTAKSHKNIANNIREIMMSEIPVTKEL
jgi:phosphate:Na+ symporter